MYLYLADNSPVDTLFVTLPYPLFIGSPLQAGTAFQDRGTADQSQRVRDHFRSDVVVFNTSTDIFTAIYDAANNRDFGSEIEIAIIFAGIIPGGPGVLCVYNVHFYRRRIPQLGDPSPAIVVTENVATSIQIAQFFVNISHPANGLSLSNISSTINTPDTIVFSTTFDSSSQSVRIIADVSLVPDRFFRTINGTLTLQLVDNALGRSFREDGVNNFTANHNALSAATIPFSFLEGMD